MADQKTTGTEARAVAGAITSMGLAEMISNLAVGIAKGQAELDFECMKIARFMGDAQIAFGKRPGSNEADFFSLIELGFTPNFYQFVDTVLELRVAVSTKFEETVEQETSAMTYSETEAASQSSYASQYQSSWGGWGVNWGWNWWNGGYNVYGYSGSSASQASSSSSFKQKNLSMTTVDAKYASTYNYAVEASSVVKTKIVPVPPPTILEELIRAKVQERKEWQRLLRLAQEAKVILGGQLTTVANMLAAAGKLFEIGSSDRKGASAELYDDALKLKEGQDSLTNEQWAVGGTAADRAEADQHIALIIAKADAIKTFYADSPSGEPEGEVKKDLNNGLNGYKGVIEAVQTKLAAMGAPAPLPAPPK